MKIHRQNIEKTRFVISLSIAVLFIATMWIVKLFELTLDTSFYRFGVMPLSLSGLKGILFSPFIHGSLNHLYSNTFPFLILLTSLLYFNPHRGKLVFFMIYIFSGFLLWFIGRSSYHIGASGIIYSLAAYLFFSGLLSKKREQIAISLAVVFLYGSLIWGLFPSGDSQISWEAHLSGFVVGSVLSIIFHDKPKISTYQFNIEENIKFVYYYDFINSSSTYKNFIVYEFYENDNITFNYFINYETNFNSNSSIGSVEFTSTTSVF